MQEAKTPKATHIAMTKSQVSKTKRQKVFERDKMACVYCQDTENLTIDHKIPKSRGGSNDISNLQTLCLECNGKKADTIDGDPPRKPRKKRKKLIGEFRELGLVEYRTIPTGHIETERIILPALNILGKIDIDSIKVHVKSQKSKKTKRNRIPKTNIK